MSLSKVVIIRAPGVLSADGTVRGPVLERLYEKGLLLLTGAANARDALASIVSPSDRVGIKINAIAGRRLTTPPEVSLPLAGLLVRAGIKDRAIVVWDRTNRELKDAGYRLNAAGEAFRIMGTDTAGMGYGSDPLEHRSIGSRFSAIQTDFISASISLAVLKDHGLAGITAGMKNYFGAIHNPNKYHDDHCDPFVADLFDAAPIKSRHRLTILDALQVQYHRGPSFHAAWADRRETMVFGFDPVAADYAGWQIIESLRRAKGLPTLFEEERPPAYIKTAERLGLGRAAPGDIQIIEDTV
jgi:uncharacterized protein (DUF362 family)